MMKAAYYAERICFCDKDFYYYANERIKQLSREQVDDCFCWLGECLDFAWENGTEYLLREILGHGLNRYAPYLYRHMDGEMMMRISSLNASIQRMGGDRGFRWRTMENFAGLIREAVDHFAWRMESLMEKNAAFYVFGAGKIADAFLGECVLPLFQQKIRAILVTDKIGNPAALRGVPVKAVSECSEAGDDVSLPVFLAVGDKGEEGAEDILRSFGFANIVFLDSWNKMRLLWNALGEKSA